MTTGAEEITGAIIRGVNAATKQGVAIAIDQMSGPYSQAELTAMGHPYALRRRGRTIGVFRLPSMPINVQSGKVRADWETVPAEVQGDDVVGVLRNDNPIIDYLQDGTNKMIPRPIQQTIEAILLPQVEGYVQRELSKVQGII